MKYKLEIMEDRDGVMYGIVTDPDGRVVYFAPGFEQLEQGELEAFARHVAGEPGFSCPADFPCTPNPQAGYEELTSTDRGLAVIYDGEHFLKQRQEQSASEAETGRKGRPQDNANPN